ncbi:MAG: 2-oxo acid dehydrogenase subunit E2 [Desulfobacterales bacterium]|nr:2-oxo acid dehydrogenase subunit E2 [Desulfobacterales bacterium]
MAQEFKMPDLGEGIHEGEILKVFVSEGDHVNEGEPLLEVETDKAAVEIPSPLTGIVEKILVKTGDMVKVGEVLITFSKKSEAQDKKLSGAHGKEPEPVKDTEENAKPSEKITGTKAQGPVPASPSTRRLAGELNVDLREVPPTGPSGLVSAEDVRKFAEKQKGKMEEKLGKPEMPSASTSEDQPGKTQVVQLSVPPLPDFSKWGPVEAKPVRSLRRATARQMALSWSQIPHVSNQDMADITKLEAFRNKQKIKIAEKGGNLTLTVFALKAAVTALKAYPYFNSSLDTNSGEIILKNYYHIGVAVNSDEGLMVPVIRDVDRKSISELAIELFDMVARARERKIGIEEMQGGTFTITNAGPMGGGYFSPIINYPEVAILGLGQARMQPVVRRNKDGNQEIVIRLMMPVVLCFDHRIADGVDAIRFTRMVIEALEDPEELFLNMV